MFGDAGAGTTGPPESRGASVIAAAVATVAISFIFITLRFISRAAIISDLGWSDWTVALGWIFSLANTIGTCLQVKYAGLGTHFDDLDPDFNFKFGIQMVYWTLLVYILGLICVKFSILLLYRRIFRAANDHYAVYAVMAFIAVAGGETFFSSIFSCVPIAAFWDPLSHPDAWCFPTVTKAWIDIGIHLAGEVAILMTPIPFVYKLTMPRKQKIAVSLLFSLGIFVVLVGLIRIHPLVLMIHTKDVLWDSALLSIWSAVEINTTIICSCSMTLRPLIVRFFPRFASSGYLTPSTNSAGAAAGPYPPTVGSRRERKLRHPEDGLFEDGELIEMGLRETESQTALRAAAQNSRDSSQTRDDDESQAGPSSQGNLARIEKRHEDWD